MNVKVYQIGGEKNEKLLGTAHDSTTGKSLVMLAKLGGASGVSLHGTMPDQYGTFVVSGEFTLVGATAEFNRAERTASQQIIQMALDAGEEAIELISPEDSPTVVLKKIHTAR